MSEEVQIALIASGSALFGAFIGVLGSVLVEGRRAREARRARVERELLEAFVAFDSDLTEWRTVFADLPRVNAPEFQESWEDLVRRSERVRASRIRLELLSPDEVWSWITSSVPTADALFEAAHSYAYWGGPQADVVEAERALHEAQGEYRRIVRAVVKGLRLAPRRTRTKKMKL